MTITISATPNPVNWGQATILKATVLDYYGNPVVNGRVYFADYTANDNPQGIGEAYTDANGVATVSYNPSAWCGATLCDRRLVRVQYLSELTWYYQIDIITPSGDAYISWDDIPLYVNPGSFQLTICVRDAVTMMPIGEPHNLFVTGPGFEQMFQGITGPVTVTFDTSAYPDFYIPGRFVYLDSYFYGSASYPIQKQGPSQTVIGYCLPGDVRNEFTCWDNTRIWLEKCQSNYDWGPSGEVCREQVCLEGEVRNRIECWDGSLAGGEYCNANRWLPFNTYCPEEPPPEPEPEPFKFPWWILLLLAGVGVALVATEDKEKKYKKK